MPGTGGADKKGIATSARMRQGRIDEEKEAVEPAGADSQIKGSCRVTVRGSGLSKDSAETFRLVTIVKALQKLQATAEQKEPE